MKVILKSLQTEIVGLTVTTDQFVKQHEQQQIKKLRDQVRHFYLDLFSAPNVYTFSRSTPRRLSLSVIFPVNRMPVTDVNFTGEASARRSFAR